METEGLGFYLSFHKYGLRLRLSLSGSWRRLRSAWWDAISKEPRSLKNGEKKHIMYMTGMSNSWAPCARSPRQPPPAPGPDGCDSR